MEDTSSIKGQKSKEIGSKYRSSREAELSVFVMREEQAGGCDQHIYGLGLGGAQAVLCDQWAWMGALRGGGQRGERRVGS